MLAPVPDRTLAASWLVTVCEMQPLTALGPEVAIGGVVQHPFAITEHVVCCVANAAGLQFVAGSFKQSVDSGPSTTLVTTGCM